jgi:hypothetical protein
MLSAADLTGPTGESIMKRNTHFALLALFAFIVLASPPSRAALLDQGDTTLDTDTNLLWLDMSHSVGVSAQSILDGTDPGALAAAGWSFASLSQIASLLENAGMSGPFDGTQSPWNFASAASIVSLLGATYGDSIQAFASEGPGEPFLYTPVVATCALCGVGGADLPGPAVPSSAFGAWMGSWLVMEAPVAAPVPEPETYAMLLAGLGLIGFVAHRRKRASAPG